MKKRNRAELNEGARIDRTGMEGDRKDGERGFWHSEYGYLRVSWREKIQKEGLWLLSQTGLKKSRDHSPGDIKHFFFHQSPKTESPILFMKLVTHPSSCWSQKPKGHVCHLPLSQPQIQSTKISLSSVFLSMTLAMHKFKLQVSHLEVCESPLVNVSLSCLLLPALLLRSACCF